MIAKLRALWKKDPGLVVSGGAHAVLFFLLVYNFAWPPHLEPETESVPVELISDNDLNQIMNGERTAKPLPTPQRRVDKVAETEERNPANPTEDAKKTTPPLPTPDKANDDPGEDDEPTVKAAEPPPPPPPPTPPAPPVPTPPERPVVKAEPPMPPPKPEMKPPPEDAEVVAPKPPPRPKQEPKKEPKPEQKKLAMVTPPKPPKRPEPPRKPEPKPKPETKDTLDQITKLLETKPPKPPKHQRAGAEVKEAKRADFSFDKIAEALDHEKPQRKASTGRQLTQLASLGLPTGHADKLSTSMKAAIDNWLIDHYLGCWSYFGYQKDYVPIVRVRLGPDGTLMAQPELKNPPNDPNLQSLAASAITAVKKCDPLPIPDWFKTHYDAWRDRSISFDLKDKA